MARAEDDGLEIRPYRQGDETAILALYEAAFGVRKTPAEWRWRFLGLPLPRWTTPAIECLETGEGNRFVFDIRFGFPLVGHVIHYRGWLERTATDMNG